MKRRHSGPRLWLALLLALALGLCAAAPAETNGAEDAEALYVENEWNYVDGSIDPGAGIPADAAGVLEAVRNAGVLRVGTEPYFAPQEFIDPSLSGQAQYVGADMELARLIAERMGVELEIIPMDFSDLLTAVNEGKCDLVISGLAFTPGRAMIVEFSKGYHYSDSDGSAILIREEDAETITGVAGLADKVIVAQSGSLQETLAAENVTNYKEFRRLSSMPHVYRAVADGSVDAAVVDSETAKLYVESNPELKLALVPNFNFQLEAQYDGYRIAAKKGEIQILYFVNGVIDELLKSGTYEKWFAEYQDYADRLGL